MTTKERERRLEQGRCTAKRCRQLVENGDGQQYVNEDGTVDRLCRRCAKRREQELEVR
jgi:ribosomal protein L24E